MTDVNDFTFDKIFTIVLFDYILLLFWTIFRLIFKLFHLNGLE